MLLVLPIVVSALPSSLQHDIVRFLPLEMGQAFVQPRPLAHAFAPWTGFVVLAGYTVAVLAAALVLLVRRDA